MVAFLSHSSEDKEFVRKVALRLGRANAKFDDSSFAPGFDFRELIKKNLDKSSIFVFFVSKRSLQSTWVKYEISEAEWRILHEQMAGAISIIIEPEIKHSDLPPWMQRCLTATIFHPSTTAHIIQNYMLQQNPQIEPVFIGRETDLHKFSRELILDIEKESPRILVFSGLFGIGRRAFGRHAIEDYLSMGYGSAFILEDTDSIDSLYLKLLDEIEELSSREKMAKEINLFRNMNIQDKGKEIARLLSILNSNNLIPIVVERGPMGLVLNEGGFYKDEWLEVLRNLNLHKNSYLVLIQTRLPSFKDKDRKELGLPEFASYKLGPLDNTSIELILKESIRKMDIGISTEKIKEIVPYINGYPPAAQYVLGFVKYHGIDILLADKGLLTSFLGQRFESFIEKLNLNEKEKDILRLLDSETSLPFEAIKAFISCSDKETSELLRKLIDLNLINITDSDFILSSPISIAVSRKLGILDRKDYSRIVEVFRKEFWANIKDVPKLSIIDTTIHALAYYNLDKLNDFKDLVLPGHLFKVAMQKYNNKRWRDAEALSRRALQLDDSLHGARVILLKSLVRQKQWAMAYSVLDEIDNDHKNERLYLHGFIEWKKGQHTLAVQVFRQAYNEGDRRLALLRDTAYCLFVLGELDDAKFFIDEALKITRNKYLVDLAAQIAIYSDQIIDAVTLIDELNNMDSYFFYNRRATLRCKQTKYVEAMEDVNKACNTEFPRLEALIQKIDIKILLDKPDVEGDILKIQGILGENSDVIRGLWCKFYLQQNKWLIANEWWQKIWQKNLPSFKDLRKSILNQKKADIMMSPTEVNEAKTELEEIDLNKQLPLLETDFEDIYDTEKSD
jgi:tetratricopeptide (TPR) repeat protein